MLGPSMSDGGTETMINTERTDKLHALEAIINEMPKAKLKLKLKTFKGGKKLKHTCELYNQAAPVFNPHTVRTYYPLTKMAGNRMQKI